MGKEINIMPGPYPTLRIGRHSNSSFGLRVRNELRTYLSQLKDRVIGARLQSPRLLRLIERVSNIINSRSELTTAAKRVVEQLLEQLETLRSEVLERRPPGTSTILKLINEVKGRLEHLMGERLTNEQEDNHENRPEQTNNHPYARAELLRNQPAQEFRVVTDFDALTRAENRANQRTGRIREITAASTSVELLGQILQQAMRDFVRTFAVGHSSHRSQAPERQEAQAIKAINQSNKLLGNNFIKLVADNTLKKEQTIKTRKRERDKLQQPISLKLVDADQQREVTIAKQNQPQAKVVCRLVKNPVNNQLVLELTGKATPEEGLKAIDTLVRNKQNTASILPLLIKTAIEAALNPEGKDELIAILAYFIPELPNLAKASTQLENQKTTGATPSQLSQLLATPTIAVEPATTSPAIKEPSNVIPLRQTIPAPIPNAQSGRGEQPIPVMAAQEPARKETQPVADIRPNIVANRVVLSALIQKLIFDIFNTGQESIFMATEVGQKAVAQLARQLSASPSINQAKPAVAKQSDINLIRVMAQLNETSALLNLNPGQTTTIVGDIQVSQAPTLESQAKPTAQKIKEIVQAVRRLNTVERETGIKIAQETVDKIYGALAAVNLVPETAPPPLNLALPQQSASASSLERIVRILERQVVANAAAPTENTPTRRVAKVRTPDWLKETINPEIKFALNAKTFLAGILLARSVSNANQAFIPENIDLVIKALRSGKIEGLYEHIIETIEAGQYDEAVSFLSDLVLEANILTEAGQYPPGLIGEILLDIARRTRSQKRARQSVSA